MNIEKEVNQENSITPEKELQYAQEGLKNNNWGEVEDCINQIHIKVPEVGLSAEAKAELKVKLEEFANECQAVDMPEENGKRINSALERARDVL